MTALRHELRRSAALVALPLLFVVPAAAAFSTLWSGFSVWDNATSAVVTSVFLAGPLAAGLAAWAASRERRRRTGYLRLLGARHPLAGPVMELAAALAWSVVAYLAVAVAVFTKTATGGATWGGPNWLWVATGGAGLVLHVIAGYVTGRAVPRPWWPPTVTILAYVFAGWNLSQWGEWWYFLSPVTVAEADVFHQLNTTLLAGQLAWYAGLATAIAALWMLLPTGRRLPSATFLVAGLALTGLGATTVVQQDQRFYTQQAGFSYQCTSTQPQVCVHPAFASELPALRRGFLALHERVAGTPADFSRVEQRQAPGDGGFTISYLPSGAGNAHVAVEEYLWATIKPRECPPPGVTDERASDYSFHQRMVFAWLSGGPLDITALRPQQQSSLRWFAALPESKRREWFAAHYEELIDCELTAEDFR
ncbi:MAG: hypothetical protein ACRDT4_17525 [Micromonosporaceae bacterium]